jgi:hypothetical protein
MSDSLIEDVSTHRTPGTSPHIDEGQGLTYKREPCVVVVLQDREPASAWSDRRSSPPPHYCAHCLSALLERTGERLHGPCGLPRQAYALILCGAEGRHEAHE